MQFYKHSLRAYALISALGISLPACSDDSGDGGNNAADDGANDDDTGGEKPTRDGSTATLDGSIRVSDASSDGGNSRADSSVQRTDASAGEADPDTSGMGDSNDPNPTVASATAMGPYKVATYTSGYPDSPAYADSTMHYPEGAAGPLPSIAIVPGFVSPQASIQAWGPFLASHGIVTFTIGTNFPTDVVEVRAAALLGAIETIEGENVRSGSPLKGKLDLTRMGLGGWSMGGGGTLQNLNTHSEFKAAIAFCPWAPLASFPNIKTPTLFLAAAFDELAAGQSQPFYESIPATTPKLLWERATADHFMNDPSFEDGAMGRYGLAFLKTYLQGDTRYKKFLLEKAPNASDWRSNIK